MPLPQDDIEGTWKVCSPKTVAEGGWEGFSAVAYFFGRELHQKLHVPVGLIESAWGGTRIEPWTPPEGFAAVPALKGEYKQVQLSDPRTQIHFKYLEHTFNQYQAWLQSARQAMNSEQIVPPVPTYPEDLLAPHQLQQATVLYNGMIHPLIPFTIRGVIWYQGEQNHTHGMIYAKRMQALITGWRALWGEGNFPFYFVQIAPYDYRGNPEKLAELWEAQTVAAQTITNCGMAVINGIGKLKNVHPPSNFYRFSKVVRRHMLVFGTGAMVTCSLLAGITVSTCLYVQERRAHLHEIAAESARFALQQDAEKIRQSDNMALSLFSSGHLAEAEAKYREVVSMRTNLLGLIHPDVAESLHYLYFGFVRKTRI